MERANQYVLFFAASFLMDIFYQGQLLGKETSGHVSKEYIMQSLYEAAQTVGVPADVLFGICTTESNLDHLAFVHNDGGAKKNDNHAFGMCQVLKSTAEKYVGELPECSQDFRLSKKTRTFKSCPLFGPKTNAYVAARFFKEQLERYNGNQKKAIAAYNTGSYFKCGPSGTVKNRKGNVLYKCSPGKTLNQRYVNRVNLARQNFKKMERNKNIQKPQLLSSL
jgi:hypothetical protein